MRQRVAVNWSVSSFVGQGVDAPELVFTDRKGAQRRGQRAADGMPRLTWKQTAERLKGLILDGDLPSRQRNRRTGQVSG
jgi:hypothetical protein